LLLFLLRDNQQRQQKRHKKRDDCGIVPMRCNIVYYGFHPQKPNSHDTMAIFATTYTTTATADLIIKRKKRWLSVMFFAPKCVALQSLLQPNCGKIKAENARNKKKSEKPKKKRGRN